MHLISLILPIYNVEKYLSACLESILVQTYPHLEIILVNDGSTDSCLKICEDYAIEDKRIKVIHKKNGGLSNARNVGLKQATGNFISFVDSDDLLSSDFYEKLLNTLLENNADIVECGFTDFETETQLENFVSTTKHHVSEIFATVKALELLMKEQLKQMVWNKLYRKEVIANIRFEENKINEDEFWTYQVFGNARKVIKIPDILYFYRQQENSIMGRQYSLKRLDGLQALEERISYMHKNFPTLENLAIKLFCFGSTHHYEMLCMHSTLDSKGIYRRNIVYNSAKFSKWSVLKFWSLSEIIRYEFFLRAPKVYLKFMQSYLRWRVKD